MLCLSQNLDSCLEIKHTVKSPNKYKYVTWISKPQTAARVPVLLLLTSTPRTRLPLLCRELPSSPAPGHGFQMLWACWQRAHSAPVPGTCCSSDCCQLHPPVSRQAIPAASSGELCPLHLTVPGLKPLQGQISLVMWQHP